MANRPMRMARWVRSLPMPWLWCGSSVYVISFLPKVGWKRYNIKFPMELLTQYFLLPGMLTVKPQKEDTTPRSYYAVSALTYLLAMVSSNMALRWVPYPTQVVGKSAKPIPVMILGVLIGRKSYSWIRYACVLTIVVGVVLFMYKESKAPAVVATDKTGLGELLLILSLSMDGLTGAVQERMRSSSAPSGQQMMFAMNFWSTLMLGFAMIVTGWWDYFSN